MKTQRIAIVVVLMLLIPSVFADDNDFGTLTYNGRTYSQARLDQITSDGAEFDSPQGTFTIPLDKVPFQVRSRFKKDYEAALAESKKASGTAPTQATQPPEPKLTEAQWQAKAIEKYPEIAIQGSELNKQFVEEYTKRRKATPAFFKDHKWPLILADELARANETPEAKKARQIAEVEAKLPEFKMEAKIIQLTDEGAIVSASLEDAEGMVPLREPVFVFGISSKIHVDGDSWNGTVWLAGNYRYTAVSGAAKTLRSFSTDREDATKRVRSTVGIK